MIGRAKCGKGLKLNEGPEGRTPVNAVEFGGEVDRAVLLESRCVVGRSKRMDGRSPGSTNGDDKNKQ